jgi:hypothetical protein
MKKQWILIGTLVAVLAIAGTVFGLTRGAGETVQGALSTQTTDATIDQPETRFGGENLTEFISPEGWPHELFVLRLATPEQTDADTLPKYWDEVQSTYISPEGWPHELFILQFIPVQ